MLSAFLKKLFEHRWPDGEPLLLADGTRWGTRVPDGSMVVAPGWTYTPIACSRCHAPELLATLEYVLNDDGFEPRASSKCRAVVRAAIAKTTGAA